MKLSLALLLATAATTAGFTSSWTGAATRTLRASSAPRTADPSTPRMAIAGLGGLAKKMKVKEIAPLLEQAKDESSALAKTIAAKGSKEPSGAVPFALKGMAGSVRCIAEYRRKGNLGVVWEVDPPVMMSVLFRQSGAHAVAALLDAATGGCDIEDVEQIVKEQENARGNFPGPLPMIVHDLVVDEVQLAQAASVGAEGIVLSVNVLGEKLDEMAASAKAYGLEPVIACRCKEELAAAGAAGAGVVALNGITVDEMIELADDFPEGAIKVGFLPLYDDKQLIEAEDAWRLRDAGFNTIWVSEVLYKFQVEDGDSARTIIKAITSKGSVKYTRASMSYNTKGEGAREYLGSLEM